MIDTNALTLFVIGLGLGVGAGGRLARYFAAQRRKFEAACRCGHDSIDPKSIKLTVDSQPTEARAFVNGQPVQVAPSGSLPTVVAEQFYRAHLQRFAYELMKVHRGHCRKVPCDAVAIVLAGVAHAMGASREDLLDIAKRVVQIDMACGGCPGCQDRRQQRAPSADCRGK